MFSLITKLIIIYYCLGCIAMLTAIAWFVNKKIYSGKAMKLAINKNEPFDIWQLKEEAENVYSACNLEEFFRAPFPVEYGDSNVLIKNGTVSFVALIDEIFTVDDVDEWDTDDFKLNSDNLIYKKFECPKTEILCRCESYSLDLVTNDYDACYLDSGDKVLIQGPIMVYYDGNNMSLQQGVMPDNKALIDINIQKRLYNPSEIFNPELC